MTDSWTEFLNGFFGRIFWTDLKIKVLNFTSIWWQVGRSMSPPFEPDPCPDHARVTSYTQPSLNLHNVPRALLPSVSLTDSGYICVTLEASDVRLRTAVQERW